MKAWVCDHPSDEYSVIYWAETRGKARVQAIRGEFTFSDYDFVEIPCKRFPAADGLARADLTDRWLLQHNWWMPCSWCDNPVHDESEAHFYKGILFCSWGCIRSHIRQHRLHRLEQLIY